MTTARSSGTDRVDSLLAAWTTATARPVPGFALPERRSRATLARVLLLIVLGSLLAAAAALIVGSQLWRADTALPPVGSCTDMAWPATPVSCEAAERSVRPGSVRIDQRRIWLTTLGAIKAAIRPDRQVAADPPDETPVWVFVYDGTSSGVTYQALDGQLVWSGMATRWIHVADATDPTTVAGRFLYDFDWERLGSGGVAVPSLMPRPPLAPVVAPSLGPPAGVVAAAMRSVESAHAVRYDLTIGSHDGDDNLIGLHSSGTIDLDGRRFAGDADGGVTGWSMFPFGGPTSGSAIVADGLFIHDQGGRWERIPDGSVPTARLLDPGYRRTALDGAFASLTFGATRAAPCGAATCQVVAMTLPPAALYRALADLSGARMGPPASDVSRVSGEMYVDPASGLPARIDATFAAGSTTWLVTVSLEWLDRAPEIGPPIR